MSKKKNEMRIRSSSGSSDDARQRAEKWRRGVKHKKRDEMEWRNKNTRKSIRYVWLTRDNVKMKCDFTRLTIRRESQEENISARVEGRGVKPININQHDNIPKFV